MTGAWDDKIKLWSLMDDQARFTYQEHQYCIYSTIWSPNNESVFASASGDYTVKIFDINGEICIRLRDSLTLYCAESHSVQTINAHQYEILACDWNKYSEHVLVSGSVDKTLKIWVWLAAVNIPI